MVLIDRLSLAVLLAKLVEQQNLLQDQAEVLDLDLQVVEEQDAALRQADIIIGQQTDALDQIVRAIEDLGLSTLIAQQVQRNLLANFLSDLIGAPTLRREEVGKVLEMKRPALSDNRLSDEDEPIPESSEFENNPLYTRMH